MPAPISPPPDRRRAVLTALSTETFDLLVVGGGSVGAGIALHAAARGLRVALVERDDFASGTSSRSTKLIHGGVRYLEQALTRADRVEFALVLEALRERAAFFRLAPYLSRRLGILTPTFGGWERLYYGAGLAFYDALSGRASLGRTRRLGAAEARGVFPTLTPHASGGVLYYDGQFDDARLNVMLVLTAEHRGAVVANYAAVTGLIKEGGRVAGATVRDALTGADFAVRARAVVNAAGPYADELRRLDDARAEPLLRTSSGVHVVVRGDLCPRDVGMLIPKTEDGRVIFVLPWLGHTVIGTTDRPAEPDPSPRPSAEDVAYLLAHAGRYLAQPLDEGDVRSAWSGLRPLVRDPTPRGRGKGTAQLARTHVIVESAGGLITVVGGKWTTFRRIAADAVAHVVQTRGLSAGPAALAEEVAVLGAGGGDNGAFGLPAGAAEEGAALGARGGDGGARGLPADVADHLAHSYGDRAGAVGDLMAAGYGKRLAPGLPYVEAEVLWAVRAEHAVRPVDVLARRMRLAFLDREAAVGSLARVADLMGGELGWGAERLAREEAGARAELARSFA